MVLRYQLSVDARNRAGRTAEYTTGDTHILFELPEQRANII
jgi:hypothetical protein